jgi:hypothetical protein
VGGDHDRLHDRHLHEKGRQSGQSSRVDTGISKSTVSQICGEIDVEVEAFRTRSLHTTCPYVWLAAPI